MTIVTTQVGEEVAAVIDSSPAEIYPLIICLLFDRGQIKVQSVIRGTLSWTEAFVLLIEAREAFDARFELPDTTGLSLKNVSKENWLIPASTLTQVSKESDEFRRVASDFDGGASSVIRIDRIENTVWLMEYLAQKQIVDNRLGYNDTEKLLFHGCPYSSAEKILEEAFDHDRIGRNGKQDEKQISVVVSLVFSLGALFGHGFYFSEIREISDRYAVPNPSTREKRILMCRVLIGRSCTGNPMMTTCPPHYDSTTDESEKSTLFIPIDMPCRSILLLTNDFFFFIFLS